MDIREYIQSGIIESYVLRLTTAQENAEVEQMAVEHNEVKQAILDFELQLEKQANEDVLQAPAFVKRNIESVLSAEFASAAVKQIPSYSNEGAIVRQLSSLKYIAAAAIILLVISTGLNFYFYSSFKSSNERYQALFNERNTLQANNASYKTQLNEMNESLQMVGDSDIVNITMKGVKGKEDNMATVFWNKRTKEVFLMANKMKTVPAGKQFQLWAIVDGKPVDAGMVGYNCVGLCKMKVIERAQAFAITLEKEGGSAAPTLTQMYVMGKT